MTYIYLKITFRILQKTIFYADIYKNKQNILIFLNNIVKYDNLCYII